MSVISLATDRAVNLTVLESAGARVGRFSGFFQSEKKKTFFLRSNSGDHNDPSRGLVAAV